MKFFFRYLFTCGDDGNIFSYIINFEEPLVPKAEATLPEHVVSNQYLLLICNLANYQIYKKIKRDQNKKTNLVINVIIVLMGS